jgi:predicted ATPase
MTMDVSEILLIPKRPGNLIKDDAAPTVVPQRASTFSPPNSSEGRVRHDKWNAFISSGELIDRKAQVEKLREAFERRLGPDSRAELILVSGAAGTGKSGLVSRTLPKYVAAKNGIHVSGKSDQLQNVEPYAAIVAAMSDLARHIRAKGAQVVAKVRDDVLDSLETESGLLIHIFPAFKDILGLDSSMRGFGSKDRLKVLFRKFLRAACSPELPLVMVMDDVQWADQASLDMIKEVVSDQKNHSLAVICIGRSRT